MDKEVVHIYNVILPCHKKEWNNAICSSMDVLSQLSHAQLFITPWTAACQAPLSVGILQARILEWDAMPSSRGCSQPRTEPRSPALQVDSLLSEPPGKTKNTRVGNLSCLQRIFPTQGSNLDVLHCRQILYQVNYQGSPATWRDLEITILVK